MERKELISMLEQVQGGALSVDEAVKRLRAEPFEDIGFARVDSHRAIRNGIAEVIYGAGKTPEQIVAIAEKMRERGQKTILITRLSPEKAAVIGGQLPLDYRKDGGLGVIGELPEPDGIGVVLVITAGTSDIPVAEEAAVTAEIFGNRVKRVYDAGVAGLHRLLANIDDIMSATVIIVIAGMEGALASVVGGLADCPVIAVPTSVGYGASFGGLAALLAMLNSCAGGVSVVNIDNGFGAAYQASLINHVKS
ncbi:MAG: nickel pincer cofactor biosynthesis protein LarB [Clostridia bacterium]|nr:nickel pincer cofactor biosynthesis protein LarB [Clostridia bacterium]